MLKTVIRLTLYRIRNYNLSFNSNLTNTLQLPIAITKHTRNQVSTAQQSVFSICIIYEYDPIIIKKIDTRSDILFT